MTNASADDHGDDVSITAAHRRSIGQRDYSDQIPADLTSARQRRVARVLEDAEHRDRVADARDSAANRRDMLAVLDAFLNDETDERPFRARELARQDRAAAREDRLAAADERARLTWPPQTARDR